MKRVPTPAAEKLVYKDLHNVMETINTELEGNAPGSNYLESYNNTFHLFEDSYKKNQQLLEKVTDMNQSFVEHAAEVRKVMKNTDISMIEIRKSKEEFNKALEAYEIEKAKLFERQGKIDDLKYQVDFLKEKLAETEEEQQLNKEIQELRSVIRSQNDELEKLNSQILQNQASTNELTEATRMYNNEHEKMIQEIGTPPTPELILTLKSEIKNKGEENNQLISKIEQNKLYKNEMRDQISTLRKEKSIAVTQKESFVITKEGLAKKTENLSQKLSLLIRSNSEAKELIRNKNIEIRQCDEDYNESFFTNVNLDSILKQTKQELDASLSNRAPIQQQISEAKATKKKLEEEKKRMELYSCSVGGIISSTSRNISAEINKVSQATIALHEAKLETNDVISEGMGASQFTNAIKNNINAMHQHIEQLESEIERMIDSVHQTEMAALTEQEKADSNIAAIEELQDELQSVIHKRDRQKESNSALREDRDTQKKLLESEKDNVQVSAHHFSQTMETVETMTHNLETLIDNIERDRSSVKVLKETITHLEYMRSCIVDGKASTDSVVKALAAEIRKLEDLLDKSMTLIQRQQKEFGLIESTNALISNQILAKEKQLHRLRNQIKTLEFERSESGKVYREKIDEIRRGLDVLAFQQQAEEKSKKLVQHCLKLMQESNELEDECYEIKLQNTALEKELRTPRNVHRLLLYDCEDPQYAANLRLRTLLSVKVYEADKELRALLEEKRKIEDRLKIPELNSVETVQQRIKAYEKAIEEKETAVGEIAREIAKERVKVRSSASFVTDIKTKVADRKIAMINLKSINSSARIQHFSPRPIAPQSFFITDGLPIIDPHSPKLTTSPLGVLTHVPLSARKVSQPISVPGMIRSPRRVHHY